MFWFAWRPCAPRTRPSTNNKPERLNRLSMNRPDMPTNRLTRLFPLVLALLFLAGCGGGGGGTTAVVGNPGADDVTPSDTGGEGRLLTYADDIAPIIQGKCLGCHTSGPNALAPIALETQEQVEGFKSAIQYTLEGSTMPPSGAPALSNSEQGKLMAWLTGTPYVPSGTLVRVSLIEAQAWDITSRSADNHAEFRPAQIDCPRGTGWLIEDDELEIRTANCNYLSLTQQSLLSMSAGTALELTVSHSPLDFNAPSEANWAISIGGTVIWEKRIPIPSDSQIIREQLQLPMDVTAGDDIVVHLRNHGNNAYTVHSLEALVPEDEELDFCVSYDSTWDAIEATVIQQTGCANSLCHGEDAAGGLDLSAGVAYANLVDVISEASSLKRIQPREPAAARAQEPVDGLGDEGFSGVDELFHSFLPQATRVPAASK